MRDETNDRPRLSAPWKRHACNASGSGRWTEETSENSKQRRFACPVGTEQRKTLSVAHRERESANRETPPKCAREVVCFNS